MSARAVRPAARPGESDRRAHTTLLGGYCKRRAACHRARLRGHSQNAPRGVHVRRRHREHSTRNDRHATAACGRRACVAHASIMRRDALTASHDALDRRLRLRRSGGHLADGAATVVPQRV